MIVSKVHNRTLLSFIAQKEEITYEALKAEYCEPTPSCIVSGRNVMFDSDLKVLESEGYITITDNLIKYVKRY